MKKIGNFLHMHNSNTFTSVNKNYLTVEVEKRGGNQTNKQTNNKKNNNPKLQHNLDWDTRNVNREITIKREIPE
jgi:hypothetical protein